MMRLVRSEWERLWAKKVTWLCFAMIPLMLFGAVKYSVAHNQSITKTAADYTYANTFPYMGLAEMIVSVFNLILLVTMALMISNEYYSGQMRMVLQRIYTYRQILFGKMVVMLIMMALFFLVYFICSYGIGYLCFEFNPNVFLFYYEQPTNSGTEIFLYTLKYYVIAYIMIVCVSSIFMAITVLSKSTTSAIALGMGFILLSLIVPEVVRNFVSDHQILYVQSSSVIYLQARGIALALTGNVEFISLYSFVLTIYMVISNLITFFILGKKDHFV
ncbi:ABC transporter permease subunit [Bacillus cytotoxicus]|uniref:ABC transporter permease n=1 Tax=unclassified Bacillus cereus group TaxID=2750818 RepID=UPI001F576FAB|nr:MULTISPECIES: ABC transporter permease subunit [unclassified Bacillus cereus group]EMA6342376.1 ABC transporter permease subunit [Bacillus cytotoxicus]